MSSVARLVNNGKRIMGEDQVFWGIYGIYNGFFKILEKGNYSREVDLLDYLEKWSINARPHFSVARGNVSVETKVFNTHQRYVQAITRREFGDVTFAVLFSDNNQRVGFMNTFQIKVDSTPLSAYISLFSKNQGQLDFYKTNLIEALDPIYDKLICDFLHYFLIGGMSTNHSIMEIPLSLTWFDDHSGSYWSILPAILENRFITGINFPTGVDTIIRKQVLTTGININHVLDICTPKLHKTLEDLLHFGVHNLKEKSANIDEPDSKFPNNKEKKNPEFPLSSAVVIATEVTFAE